MYKRQRPASPHFLPATGAARPRPAQQPAAALRAREPRAAWVSRPQANEGLTVVVVWLWQCGRLLLLLLVLLLLLIVVVALGGFGAAVQRCSGAAVEAVECGAGGEVERVVINATEGR